MRHPATSLKRVSRSQLTEDSGTGLLSQLVRGPDIARVQLCPYTQQSHRMPERLPGPGDVRRDLHDQRLHERQVYRSAVLVEPVQHPFTDFLRPRMLPCGGRRCLARSRPAPADRGAQRPTIINRPYIGRPTTTALGWLIGPMTAAHTFLYKETCCWSSSGARQASTSSAAEYVAYPVRGKAQGPEGHPERLRSGH